MGGGSKTKKSTSKRAKRASDASVKPFTGPASEAEASWGEKAPLLEGQSAGTREDWEEYFKTATNSDQRNAMIKKSADACFSKHPFARIYVQPLTKTIDMFVEAGMPVQPWLDANYPGSRRHPKNEIAGAETAQERMHAPLVKARQDRHEVCAQWRAKGEHRGRDGELVEEPSDTASLHFIRRMRADKLLFMRGVLGGSYGRDVMKILAVSDYALWPSPCKDIHCGGCLRHPLDGGGLVCEHDHETDQERVVATDNSCNTGAMVLIDWLRACGATKEHIAAFGAALKSFLGRGGAPIRSDTFASVPPLCVARRGASASAGGAQSAAFEPLVPTTLLTRAKRIPLPLSRTYPDASWNRGEVVAVYLDLETTRIDPATADIVQLGLYEATSGASFEALVMPEDPISYGAFWVHGLKKKTLADAGARGFPEVWRDATAWLDTVRGDSAELLFVAHNGNDFDFIILDRVLLENDLPLLGGARLDTLPLAKKLVPGRNSKGGYTLARLYRDATNQPIAGHHGALADARALSYVLRNLLREKDFERFLAAFVAAWRRCAAGVLTAAAAAEAAPAPATAVVDEQATPSSTPSSPARPPEPPAKRSRVSPAREPRVASPSGGGALPASSPDVRDALPPEIAAIKQRCEVISTAAVDILASAKSVAPDDESDAPVSIDFSRCSTVQLAELIDRAAATIASQMDARADASGPD